MTTQDQSHDHDQDQAQTRTRTIRLRLEQPTHVGTGPRADFVRQTELHVPGWTLRGAFAAAWIREHGLPGPSNPKRAEFIRLFEGGVRFGPLHAFDPPASLAVATHKYPPTGLDCQPEIDQAQDRTDGRGCGGCGSPYEGLRGFREPVEVRRRPGLAIGDDGLAKKGELFAIDSLVRGQHFTGEMVGSAEDLDRLMGLRWVRVGGRRVTHGMGTLQTVTGHPNHPPTRQTLKQRGGPAAGAAHQGATGFLGRRRDGRLVLRLASPAVFVDHDGRPSDRPSTDELATALGVDAVVEQVWTRWESIGGWHAASGLPKPTECAVAAGSTYLVRVAAEVGPERQAGLAARGLGLRRHEGFGHLGPATPLTPTQRTLTGWHERCRALEANGLGEVVTLLRAVAVGEADPSAVQPFLDRAPRDALDRTPDLIRKLAALTPYELRVLFATGDS